MTLPTIIGDRTTNEEILAARVLHGGPRPRMHVSRGLRQDLSVIVQASRDGPVLVVPRVTSIYLAEETQRVAAQALALAGYRPPQVNLEQVAVDRLATTVRETLGHLTAPLLFHDAAAQFPHMSLTGFTVFGYPVTEPAPTPSSADEQPSDTVIIEHARFLAGTDHATLRSMHAPFLHATASHLFQTWDSYFEAMELAPAYRELAVRARQVLHALQSRQQQSGQEMTAVENVAHSSPAEPPPAAAPYRPKTAAPADVRVRQRLAKSDITRRVDRPPVLRPELTGGASGEPAHVEAAVPRRSEAARATAAAPPMVPQTAAESPRPAEVVVPLLRSRLRHAILGGKDQSSQPKVTVASDPKPSSNGGVFRALRPNRT